MNDPASGPEATQETFISHLIELRSRLMRSIVAVVAVLVCLFPFAKEIYATLAAPLLRALPKGSTMIATDVTGTFLVPLKVTLLAAFLLSLRYVIVGAFIVGAVFTPPDILSQVMLAVPLWLLFELGLLVSRFVSVTKRESAAPAEQKLT